MFQEIQITSVDGRPLEGRLEFSDFSGTGQKQKPVMCRGDGIARVKSTLLNSKVLLIFYPEGSYWVTSKRGDEFLVAPVIRCEPFDKSLLYWPEHFLTHKIFEVKKNSSNQPVKIGVVDSGPYNLKSTKPILGIDLDGNKVSTSIYSDKSTHGTNVASILIKLLEFSGIDFELTVVDARKSNSERLTLDEINRAVMLLVKQNIPLINISHGCYISEVINSGYDIDAEYDRLETMLKRAAQYGTVCFCSTGNDIGKQATIPSYLFRAVGISALGVAGIYPETSHASSIAAASIGEGLGVSACRRGRAFISVDSTFGPGTNIFCPGVGIPVIKPNGSIGIVNGTSYAAPLAVGCVAVAFAINDRHASLSERDRCRLIYSVLRKISDIVDTDGDWPKMRIPLLTKLLKNDNIISFKGKNE